MKIKSGSFMQNHVEKLVLGFAVLVLLVFAGYFLLASPYSGGDEAITELQREITKLDGKLRNDQLPETTVPNWGEFFVQRSEREVIAFSRFEIPLSLPGIGTDLIGDRDDVASEVEYHLPNVPVAEEVAVRAGHAMVSPESLSGLNVDSSGDVRYVSVGASIDMQEWIDRLQQGPRVRQIPERLWRGLFGIAGVALQRQQYDPASGTWLEPTVVQTLPEQLAYLPSQWGGEQISFTDDSAMEAIQTVRANQDAIARPDFPEQIGGLPWLPPDSDQMTLTPDQHDELHRIRTQITDLTTRIQRIQRRIGVAPDEARVGAQTPEARDTSADPEQRRQLEELLQERDEYIAERDQLMGLSTETTQRAGRMLQGQGWDEMREDPRMPEQPAYRDQETNEQESMRIDVWAHDLTVEPGKTYRYRVVVMLINPLFRNANLSDAQRAVHFNQLAIGPDENELEASDWSESVAIDPAYHLFFVGMSSEGQVGRFQIWTVSNGRWQTANFEHYRGDPIGGVETKNTEIGRTTVDFSVGKLLVDILEDMEVSSRSETRGALLVDSEDGEMSSITMVDEDENETIRRLKAEAELEESYLSATATSASTLR